MHFVFLIILFCFFIFLYVLYYISKDDFIIVRKDVSLESIFSTAFLVGFFSLISSRLFFAFFSQNQEYLNPIVFLAFPYFPGLSLTGSLIGGSLFLYFYTKYKKMPAGKIFDLFTMSFIYVLPLGFLINFIILFGKTTLFFNILFFISIFIFFLFAKIIFPFSTKGEIKDGSLGLIFLSLFAFFYFTIKLFLDIKDFSFIDFENIMLLFLIFTPLIILINQEIMDKFLSKK
jgi:hypothetical protein